MQGIYQVDPYLFQYRTKVAGSIEEDGRTGILFEETIFYPEGGGQPSDRGTLVCDTRRSSHEVLHVEQRPQGIVHWIAGTVQPIIGASVLLTVDAERRRDHMQQHHGQHILSAVFERNYGWETVGFHLGEESCTIDLTVQHLPPEILKEAEVEVNRIVMENLPIKIEHYHRTELTPELLQKLPPDQEQVRLVVIPSVDENACCGTHPRFTGEVGPVKLLRTEKVRGCVRLHFICGERTVHWMWQTAETLRQLEQAAGASGSEAISRLEKREAELKRLQKERKELLFLKYDFLAGRQAERAAKMGDTVVALEHFPEADMETLRGTAAAWCANPGRAAIFTGGSGPFDVVLARGAGVTVSMNQLASNLWPLLKGKGGGSADLVQGKAQELLPDAIKKTIEQYFK